MTGIPVKITMALKLSYPHVEKADEATIREMMARLFLVSIDLYDGLKHSRLR